VRDTAISKAIADRKIEASKRDFYERMWEVDADETFTLLMELPKGGTSAPEVAATPYGSAAPAAAAPGGPEDYPDQHLNQDERERIARATAGLPPQRIVSEPGGGV
jgi:hypothetical protein